MDLELKKIPIGDTIVELFVPAATQVQEAYEQGRISFPYWSQVWPSSIALSQFILDNPGLVREKKIIELGAGLGLPSIVAAPFATAVLSSDIDLEAIKAIEHSARHNALINLDTAFIDWTEPAGFAGYDVMFLSDINYDPAEFSVLRQLVLSFLENDEALVILATPQRLAAREFVSPLANFRRQTQDYAINHNKDLVDISVLLLQKQV